MRANSVHAAQRSRTVFKARAISADLDGEPGVMVFLSDHDSPRSSTGWRPGMIAHDAPVAEYW